MFCYSEFICKARGRESGSSIGEELQWLVGSSTVSHCAFWELVRVERSVVMYAVFGSFAWSSLDLSKVRFLAASGGSRTSCALSGPEV